MLYDVPNTHIIFVKQETLKRRRRGSNRYSEVEKVLMVVETGNMLNNSEQASRKCRTLYNFSHFKHLIVKLCIDWH